MQSGAGSLVDRPPSAGMGEPSPHVPARALVGVAPLVTRAANRSSRARSAGRGRWGDAIAADADQERTVLESRRLIEAAWATSSRLPPGNRMDTWHSRAGNAHPAADLLRQAERLPHYDPTEGRDS